MKYPDIYFTKEYQDLFAPTEFGGEPKQFACSGIDYRFYKRPIKDTPYFDIVSPYGYSGPVAMSDNARWVEFMDSFNSYCNTFNIIAEFARLHPFIDQPSEICHVQTWKGILYEHDIFYVDLTKSEDEIWKGFDKGCKSSIKKAQRLGLTTQIGKGFNFIDLYASTMQRVGAAPGYTFDPIFYNKLSKIADVISIKDDVAETCLLKYGDYCHYFLSASKGDSSGANNLILWDAIKWAKLQGCKIFNLGGGLKAGDTLESFKRSFTNMSVPFYTYRKIHNQEVYNKLCLDKGLDPESEGFFPTYRRE